MSKRQKFPFEIEEVDEDQNELFKKEYQGVQNLVSVGPKNYISSETFKEMADIFYNYEVRSSDVWLFGFPRSGTTLTQEILWLLGNNLDYEKASKQILDHRFPVIDHVLYMDANVINSSAKKNNPNNITKDIAKQYEKPHYIQLQEMKERRFIKAHLPISLMNPQILTSGCKVVYCARNPKDVVVSLYFVTKLFYPVGTFTFEQFWKMFKNGFFWNTPWFEHVKEGWDLRNKENFLFLFYEDMVKDKRNTILKIAKFLDKKLTVEELDKLEDHVSLSKFKKNKSVNNDHFKDIGIATHNEECSFIRKGKVGGWRDHFTPEMTEEADEWIKENMKKYGIDIPM